jgi:hypothetical protein
MESLIVLGNFYELFQSVLYPSICGHCVIIDLLRGEKGGKEGKVSRVSENKLIQVLSHHIWGRVDK